RYILNVPQALFSHQKKHHKKNNQQYLKIIPKMDMNSNDQQQKANKETNKNMLIAFGATLGVILVIALVGFLLLRPDAPLIEGQAEADQVRISSKVPGRIEDIRVKEGQSVKAGDTLGCLYIPDIKAKQAQAEAAKSAAMAQNNKAIKGARSEQIAGAYQLWQKAKAGLEVAEKSYNRVEPLFKEGVITAQKRDEVYANYQAMMATEKAAHQQYIMAKNGAEKEDKEAAKALVARAQGAVDEVNSYIEESILIAPISGEIADVFPLRGELVGTGAPIMNIMDTENIWITFNIREDYLHGITIGSEIEGLVPALENKVIKLKVDYMKNLGTYAVWKATKTTGQYDIKTFEIRSTPLEKVEGLRPGMTVLLKR
ncbi:MAG: efflux RND transporter periplasmic adaptor subunit, partial [Flavobacteriales bacterium]|nr:efflux RND transporter periplasmic adaptor subunit [Flavobacteriales bacterium]